MVGTWGLEPQTSTVSRQRSNQLSYAPTRQRFYHRAGSLAPPAPHTILVDVQFPNRSGSSDCFFVFAHPAVQSGPVIFTLRQSQGQLLRQESRLRWRSERIVKSMPTDRGRNSCWRKSATRFDIDHEKVDAAADIGRVRFLDFGPLSSS